MTDADGRLHLARAGIDIEQALAYCGDEEGFREIVAIFHAEGEKRRSHLSRYFKEQDWKNYVIFVHALKSNAKGIGAGKLSEMARKLEMAGKENRIGYILEHHEAMMENHDRLLDALTGNTYVYPDADKGFVSETDGPKPDASASADGPEETAPTDADDSDSLQNLLAQIEEKLSSFESDGLSEMLDRLAAFSHDGISLTGLADQLRRLTQDFDFLGASEVLERMGN